MEATEERDRSFHSHPPLLQARNLSRSPHTTPRNVIAPDVTTTPSTEPTEAPRQQFTPHQRPTAVSNTRHEFSTSAAKYVVADDDVGAITEQAKPVNVPVSQGGRYHSRFRTISVSVPRYVSQVTRRTTQIFVEARKTYKHVSLQQFMAYMLLLFGMLSECTTPAPRFNVPIGIALFMTSITLLDHRPVIAGLCIASFVDIAWLLRPQEESFNGHFQVKFTRIASFSLAVCLAVKIWLIFSTYSDMGPEPDEDNAAAASTSASQPSVQLWRHHIKYYFPRKTLPRRSHLSFEVLMRVMALIWIHGLSGVALFFLSVIATMFYSDAEQIQSTSVGLPLNLAMIFRSATILTCYFVATNHMDYYGCLKLSGCSVLAKCDERSAGDVVLKYNAKWMRMLQRVKVLDGLMGVYLVFVMYAAFHSGTFFSSDQVTVILGLTAAIILLMDFWTPLLIMVVARCGVLLHKHHRRGTVNVDPYFPNQLEWEEEKDGNSSSSSSSSSGSPGRSSLDELSSNSSSEFSSSSSSSGSKARRRRRRMRKRNVLKSARAPLIPAGRRPLSTPIVDAQALEVEREDALELLETARSSGKGVWIRHWDEASRRAYLVHSATGEAVWEVVQKSESTDRQSKTSSRRHEAQSLPVSARQEKKTGLETTARANSPTRKSSFLPFRSRLGLLHVLLAQLNSPMSLCSTQPSSFPCGKQRQMRATSFAELRGFLTGKTWNCICAVMRLPWSRMGLIRPTCAQCTSTLRYLSLQTSSS